MSQNSTDIRYPGGWIPIARTRLTLVLVCMTISLMIGMACASQEYPDGYEATIEAERVLTAAHGEEVENAIEVYQSRVGSFEIERDPQSLSEIATGPLLERLQDLKGSVNDDSPWLVTDLVSMNGVRVLEYSSTRFKAIGCGALQTNEVTREGEIIKAMPPQQFRIIYAFALEDSMWKAVAAMNITDRDIIDHDWSYVSEWTKEALGDVPGYADRDCITDF